MISGVAMIGLVIISKPIPDWIATIFFIGLGIGIVPCMYINLKNIGNRKKNSL